MQETDILALHFSPRANGNSAILLDEFMKGAESKGAKIKLFSVKDLDISGCIGCGACEKDGKCVIDDDMQKIYPYLETVPFIVVSSSIYFYDVPSQGKAIIDRSQAMWSKRYLMDEKGERPNTKGFLISVGATKGRDLFLPSSLSIKYFFDALGLPKTFESLFVNKTDALGKVKKNEKALREAYEAGIAFAIAKFETGNVGCN